jgi:hypothetical protein
VERAARHSLCFGLYEKASGKQVGLTRVVTDHATFAYLCDVYVLEEHRGHGLGKWLMRTVSAHPCFSGARRVMLGTLDAHGLYRQFGFVHLANHGRVSGVGQLLGRGGPGQIDGVVAFAGVVAADHEEHKQLQHEVEQRDEVRFTLFGTAVTHGFAVDSG